MNVMEYYEKLNDCSVCKKCKAIEIIKKKFEFGLSLYSELIEQKLPLTQQEYELLKEVLYV